MHHDKLLKYGPYNFEFQNKDEFALLIMFFCDKDLKYFSEYQQALEISETSDDAKQQLIKIFGFYSRKLYSIEMHYSLLLMRNNRKNTEINLNRKLVDGGSINE